MKKIVGLILCFFLIFVVVSVIADVAIDETNFPDENFREYVSKFDLGRDGVFSNNELNEITDISCSYANIKSLQGIEHLYALEFLVCNGNQLTSLDVSNNISLKSLDCKYNQLTDLDVSKNTKLESLECDNNQLSNLSINKNTELKFLSCNNNQLTNLDVRNNMKLKSISCSINQLTNLDVRNNMKLKSISCSNNRLMTLDIYNNTALESLFCYENCLMDLDVSNNTSLKYLSCEKNQLSSLDVRNNMKLESLFCGYNQLMSLDISENNALYNLNCKSNQLNSLEIGKNNRLKYLYCENNNLKSLDVSKCQIIDDAFIKNKPDDNGTYWVYGTNEYGTPYFTVDKTVLINSGETDTLPDVGADLLSKEENEEDVLNAISEDEVIGIWYCASAGNGTKETIVLEKDGSFIVKFNETIFADDGKWTIEGSKLVFASPIFFSNEDGNKKNVTLSEGMIIIGDQYYLRNPIEEIVLAEVKTNTIDEEFEGVWTPVYYERFDELKYIMYSESVYSDVIIGEGTFQFISKSEQTAVYDTKRIPLSRYNGTLKYESKSSSGRSWYKIKVTMLEDGMIEILYSNSEDVTEYKIYYIKKEPFISYLSKLTWGMKKTDVVQILDDMYSNEEITNSLGRTMLFFHKQARRIGNHSLPYFLFFGDGNIFSNDQLSAIGYIAENDHDHKIYSELFDDLEKEYGTPLNSLDDLVHCFQIIGFEISRYPDYLVKQLEEAKESGQLASWNIDENTTRVLIYDQHSETTSMYDCQSKSMMMLQQENIVPYSIGSVVTFGRYEQDNNFENGPEEIEWLVLDRDEKDQRVLLLSKYGLELLPYMKSDTKNPRDSFWEVSTLRSWLNGTFLETAFNEAERSGIMYSLLDNSDSYTILSDSLDQDVYDWIFLLSITEANKYLDVEQHSYGNIKARVSGTPYVMSKTYDGTFPDRTAEGLRSFDWWLRSLGYRNNEAAIVCSAGNLYDRYNNDENSVVVRPALWLDLESLDHINAALEMQVDGQMEELKENQKNNLEDTLTEKPEASFSSDGLNKIGEIIKFGVYPQSSDGTEKTSIDWIILDFDRKNNAALVLSRYGLDVKQYHDWDEDVTWETCTLRKWLNNDFLDAAFSEDEKSKILTTMIDNSFTQGCSEWNTTGGNNTSDKVFLLSFAEADKYLGKNKNDTYILNTQVSPTDYAKTIGAYTDENYKTLEGNEAGWWWLRSPGTTQKSAVYVQIDGELRDCLIYCWAICVRPALWINVDMLQ